MRQIAVLEWGPVSLYYRKPKERLNLKKKFVKGGPFLPMFSSGNICDNACGPPCDPAASVAAFKEATGSTKHVADSDTTRALQGDVYQCSVRYGLSTHRKLDAAIRNLRLAFGYGFPEAVGYVNVKARKHRCAPERAHFLQTLESWAIMKDVDAVIWVDYESLASKIKMVGLADFPKVQKQFVRYAFECACVWRRPLLPDHIRRQRVRQAGITEMTSWKKVSQRCAALAIQGFKGAQCEEERGPCLSRKTSSKASCDTSEADGPANEASGMLRTMADVPAKCETCTSIRFVKSSLGLSDFRGGRGRLNSDFFSTRKRMSRSGDESLLLRRMRTLSSLRSKQRLYSLLRGASENGFRRRSVITRMLRDAQRRHTGVQRTLKEESESNSTTETCIPADVPAGAACTAAISLRRSTVFTNTPVTAIPLQQKKTVRKGSQVLLIKALQLQRRS